MTGLALLLLAVLAILCASYAPGYLVVRTLSGSRALAIALAPTIAAAGAGTGAMIAPALGIRWSLAPFATVCVILIALAAGLARCGIRLPATAVDGPAVASSTRVRFAWAGALAAALAVTVVPIAVRAGRADAVLERYDTLYHLTALRHIRDSGNGSSLELNAIASTTSTPASYPAAFHDLASLVPGIEIPIVLNGAVLSLSLVPWIIGTALLARVAFPRVTWAAPTAAVAAALIPACPVNLWIHLSPIPNLVGFAMLPGALAAAISLWDALVLHHDSDPPAASDPRNADVQHSGRPPTAQPTLLSATASLAVLALAGVGLALLHPNVAVTALILLAVVTAVTIVPSLRTRPGLLAVPVLALVPVALLTYTPLGARVTGFSGGLQVPWSAALAEVGLGLLTVWPMALGAIIAALWWPGLIATARSPQKWLTAAWIVIAAIYLDAAVDSPLNLSVLYFRGQDRIAMPLAMLSCVLVVPGLQAYGHAARGAVHAFSPRGRRIAIAAVLAIAVLAAASSIPTRLDDAAKNLAREYPGRGRFLQDDELNQFARFAPELEGRGSILASPYSGAAHMYALHGLHAYFPVAGVALKQPDRAAIAAVPLAGSSAEHCRALLDRGIGYVYQERRLYQFDPAFTPIAQGGDDLGPIVFETDHSRLIQVQCDPV